MALDPHINPATGVWDDNYFANIGSKQGSGGVPQFNFDFAAEAEKAYGELGTYYAKILDRAEGNMNRALAYLVEDYDRGLRINREDSANAVRDTRRAVTANAQDRGIYNLSAFDKAGGTGLADRNISEAIAPIETNQKRYEETAGIMKNRQETELKNAFELNKDELEQRRRTEASTLSTQRGQRAYGDYQRNTLFNPALA